MKKQRKILALTTGLALVIAACSEDNIVQPGTRYTLDGQVVTGVTQQNNAVSLSSSPNTWTQQLGGASHVQGNASLGSAPKAVLALNLNDNVNRAVYGASLPVSDGQTVFVHDAAGRIQALRTDGTRLWAVGITPLGEEATDGYGGGLALDGEAVYATTGFGEVVALNRANGAEMWRYKSNAPLRNPPLLVGNLLVFVTPFNQAVALDKRTGVEAWLVYGSYQETNGRLNAGAPASANGKVVIPFRSGEVVATDTNGQMLWSRQSVLNGLPNGVFADIASDPVILGDRVIVGTNAGIAALSLATGETLWQTNIGVISPVIVSGNSIFAVTDRKELTRIRIDDGQTGWTQRLQLYTNPNGAAPAFWNTNKHIFHFAPRLAGGAIHVAGDDGYIRRYNPSNGSYLGANYAQAPIAAAPIVAGGIMYVTTTDGRIIGLR